VGIVGLFVKDESPRSDFGRMEIFKEVGSPAAAARRFDLERLAGTHGIGYRRMATERAVTIGGAPTTQLLWLGYRWPGRAGYLA